MLPSVDFTWYNHHFAMPSAESGGVSNMWYSYEVGPVHFVSLLTETDLGAGNPGPIENVKGNMNGPFGKPNQQIDWLKADLASVDRKKTPWLVVGLHRPWVRIGLFCRSARVRGMLTEDAPPRAVHLDPDPGDLYCLAKGIRTDLL